jgi:hypothetical protein
VDLFRALTQASKQSTQGLWAELFLISCARDTVTMLESWRETPEDHFDFKLGHQRIEVKSTVNSVRQHFFSLEQLRPENDIQVLVASIFVQRSGAGTSIQQLLDRIRTKVQENPELLTRLDLAVATTLGSGLQTGLGEQYDEQKAISSLMFFKSQQIPSIERPIPDGISDLRFRVDLVSCLPETRVALQEANGLFKAAIRSR